MPKKIKLDKDAKEFVFPSTILPEVTQKKPAKRAVKRTLWASCDLDVKSVEVWRTKPEISGFGIYHCKGSRVFWWCESADFRKAFGFVPRPGQCIEFENTAKVVK